MENNTDFNKMISERLFSLEIKMEALTNVTLAELSIIGSTSKVELTKRLQTEILQLIHPSIEKLSQKYERSFLLGLTGDI